MFAVITSQTMQSILVVYIPFYKAYQIYNVALNLLHSCEIDANLGIHDMPKGKTFLEIQGNIKFFM